MNEINIQDLGQSFNLKKTCQRALKHWYIVVIFFGLSLAYALYVHQTTKPVYLVNSKMLISSQTEAAAPAILTNGGMPGVTLGGQSNLENQLILLTSNQQVERTIKQLDFSVSYFKQDFLRVVEIYKSSPFKVIMDTTQVKFRDMLFELEFVSENEFVLKREGGGGSPKRHKFFEKIEEPKYTFAIVPVAENLGHKDYMNQTYYFRINTLKRLVEQYKDKIEIERPKSNVTIVTINVSDGNAQKGIDFLDKLMQNSVAYTLERKNQVANNTVNFIEKELMGVSDSLSAAEKVLEDFRSRNEVMDVSMQGQMIIQQLNDLETQRAGVKVRLDYYNYLIDYLQNNMNVQELKVPSAMGVEDPGLSQLLAELSVLNAEKSSLQFNSRAINPGILKIDHQIQKLKSSIIENAKSVIETTNMTLGDLEHRIMSLGGQIRKLPKTEQMLVGINRKFQFSNEMYTFLLQKRSEAQLAKASNLPDNEIVESAELYLQIEPNIKKILLVVLVVGLFLPVVVIFLLAYYNGNIQDKDDVESLTNHPILGEIPFDKKRVAGSLLTDKPRTALAESIRSIRTALGYYCADSNNSLVLVTSALPGEGKSFLTTNLAVSYAQLGKRVVLLGYDLRNPGLGCYFGKKDDELGLSNYYSNTHGKESLIQESGVKNLDLLLAGPMPPNPSELIAGEKTARLIESLKPIYDVIVIDTPPLGLVADANILSKYADVCILVTKINYTPKALLSQLLKDKKNQRMPNMAFVVNGVSAKDNGYGGYGAKYYQAN